MTELGAARTHERYRMPPPPPPQAMPVARPMGPAPDTLAYASPASRAAAREAALAALSAARPPGQGHHMSAVAAMTAAPPPGPPGFTAATATGRGKRPAARRFGGLGVPQILCWQLVLVAFVLAAGRPWPVAVAMVIAGVVAVALTAVRLRGRWLYEWLGSASRYLLRDRDRDLRSSGEAGQELLRLLSPEAVGVTGDVGGETVFMLSRAEGIIAVLQPKAAGKAMPSPGTLLPPPQEQALDFAAQVVHHAGTDRGRPPRVWVALQALRTVDVHRDADVRQALGNVVRRVRRRLGRDGLPVRALAENEVLGALASLSHVRAGRARIREDWRFWHSGPISQATFRLDGWAELSPAMATQLSHRLLAAAPRATVTIAVTARRAAGETEPRIDAALRVAAPGLPAVEHAVRELSALALARGITMERLDGRHASGLAATLPIGVS